jgi:hypothetical protein
MIPIVQGWDYREITKVLYDSYSTGLGLSGVLGHEGTIA